MDYFDKVFDHYRRLHRAGFQKIGIANDNGNYWLCDNYTLHKIPTGIMELNPRIFQKITYDYKSIIKKAESGVPLKATGLYRKDSKSSITLVPYVADCETKFKIWFDKTLLGLFSDYADFVGTAPLEPAAVKMSGETVGIILPCREKSDIDILQFVDRGALNA